jgi:hypothetical protein
MKRIVYLALVVALFSAVLFAASAGQGAQAKEPKILEFDTMIGVPRPYTGAANAIRGVPGGGLPWVIGSAHGELKQSGKLEIEVTGLVFDPNDAAVPADRKGANTIPNFKAIVSCQSKDATGAAVIANVETGLFSATTGLATAGGGNAKIEAQLTLPQPCIAPIIFVTSPTGAWFAVTGK